MSRQRSPRQQDTIRVNHWHLDKTGYYSRRPMLVSRDCASIITFSLLAARCSEICVRQLTYFLFRHCYFRES